MNYTPGMVRRLLSDYQLRAQGARMRAPEDRLGTRAPPLQEAPWAGTSCVWSDIEQAMRALPYRDGQILFMAVCQGESSWRNGMKRYNWREKVGDYWGITGGDVNKVVDESIQAMCDSLNGVQFNYEREAETVNEHDTQSLPDIVDDGKGGKVRSRFLRAVGLR